MGGIAEVPKMDEDAEDERRVHWRQDEVIEVALASVHWEDRLKKKSPEPLHQWSSGQEGSESERTFAVALPVEVISHRHTSVSHHIIRKKGLGIHLVIQILVKHFHPCQLPES